MQSQVDKVTDVVRKHDALAEKVEKLQDIFDKLNADEETKDKRCQQDDALRSQLHKDSNVIRSHELPKDQTKDHTNKLQQQVDKLATDSEGMDKARKEDIVAVRSQVEKTTNLVERQQDQMAKLQQQLDNLTDSGQASDKTRQSEITTLQSELKKIRADMQAVTKSYEHMTATLQAQVGKITVSQQEATNAIAQKSDKMSVKTKKGMDELLHRSKKSQTPTEEDDQ